MQDSQRKSCKLAEKAKRTPGKNSMQLAQDVGAKKLGDPSPSSTDASSSGEFNRLAQYLDRPLTKQSMEALTALIEHRQPKRVKKTRMRVRSWKFFLGQSGQTCLQPVNSLPRFRDSKSGVAFDQRW